MHTVSQRRAWSIAAVVTALALAGLLAVVSSGDAAQVARTASVELIVDACTDQSCQAYPIAKGAEYSAVNLRVRDVDGQAVGRSRCSCLSSRAAGSVCDMVLSLRDGGHTANGTVLATGLFRPLADDRSVSTYAITGGTGAYTGASGYATEGWDDSRHAFVITLHLLHT
jgi:hypothetical protein